MTAPRPRFHKIRSLEVKGEGFLDGLKLNLDPQLNCVIGGRGTGKTSILQFLRFVLASPPAPGPQATAFKELIEHNLKKGQIKVTVETKDGLKFTVSRTASGEPEVVDSNNQRVEHPLHQGAVFEIDIYGAHEIESIAVDNARQLAIIDRWADDELRKASQEIAQLLHALEGNARTIESLEAEAIELEEGLSDLPGIRTRLSAMPEIQGEHGKVIEQELEDKRLRDRRDAVLGTLKGILTAQQEALDAATGHFEDLDKQVPAELVKPPEGESLGKAKVLVAALRDEVEPQLARLTAAVEAALKQLGVIDAEQRRLAGERDRRYQETLARHEQEKGRAHERLSLQNQVLELEKRQALVKEKRQEVKAAQEERSRLMGRLVQERQRRTRSRLAAAQTLNGMVGPSVRLDIVPRGDSSAYSALLTSAFRGSRTTYTTLVESIVKTIAPRDLARMVQEGGSLELIASLNESKERVTFLLRTLTKDPALVYKIETVEVQDLPKIKLLDEGVPKEVAHLSTGQRCTAILPLLLLDSERPLIIDQPEDNLDNAYIYETVVKRILEVKGKRQLLFATHNPNIPVLGEAMIFIMGSDGHQARVVGEGTVDSCQAQVETILEGGKDAYRKRGEKYGEKFASKK